MVNAAGPWVDAVRLLSEPEDQPRLRLTKGVHLGIRTERIGLSRIVVMNAPDKRGVFAIPRGGVTYLGTTDVLRQPRGLSGVTLEDVITCSRRPTARSRWTPSSRPDDVVNGWAGLRPLLFQEGKAPSELSRRTR
jgi:glycerol-3-phosphate dehydrogenase